MFSYTTTLSRKVSGLILILFLTACGGGGGGGGANNDDNGGNGNNNSPVAPSVLSISPSAISTTDPVVIVFSKSMDDTSHSIDGTLALQSDGGSWSTTTVTNDTFTINPSAEWSEGFKYTLTVDATDTEASPLSVETIQSDFDVFSGTVVFVSSTANDDSGDGLTPETAKQTIRAAIDAVTAPAYIMVNAGIYNVNSDPAGTQTHVLLKEGVSLYGGYNNDFTQRNVDGNESTINDISAALGSVGEPNRSIEVGAGITGATIIDGFTVNGSTQIGVEYTAAIWVHDITSPMIKNNTISGGSGSKSSYGVNNQNSSTPTVQGNKIYGGSGVNFTIGILNESSPSIVRDNTIDGGSGTYTTGVSNQQSSPTIQNNTIDGGDAIIASNGIENFISSPTINNNLIYGGSGNDVSVGINDTGNSNSTIQNNTIDGGNGSTASYGITTSFGTTIENNIIRSMSAGTGYCIYELTVDGDPDSLRNNALFQCDAMYYDFDAACVGDNDGDANNNTCSFTEMEALSDFGISGVSGNTVFYPGFAHYDGPDGDTSTMEDNDWHLGLGAPDDVKHGGLNLSTNFTTDKDGNPRTAVLGDSSPLNAGAAGWSIGAYEYD